MTVDSGTRWLPEALKPSAQSRGECASLGTNAGHQLQSFGRRRNGVLAPVKSRVAGHIKLLRNCEEFSVARKFYRCIRCAEVRGSALARPNGNGVHRTRRKATGPGTLKLAVCHCNSW